jgi:uncharacterized BrkB/YihY/UPF0761 family membrane protein
MGTDCALEAPDVHPIGPGIALMVWLYWAGFPMLVGAELNGVLAKRLKQTP